MRGPINPKGVRQTELIVPYRVLRDIRSAPYPRYIHLMPDIQFVLGLLRITGCAHRLPSMFAGFSLDVAAVFLQLRHL